MEHSHTLLKNLGLDLMLFNQFSEAQSRNGETIIKNVPAMFCFELDKEARLNLIQRFSDFLSFSPWNLSTEKASVLFALFQDLLEKSNLRPKVLAIPWIKALAASGNPSLCKIAYALWLQVFQKDDLGPKIQKELYNDLFIAFLNNGQRTLAVNMFLTMHKRAILKILWKHGLSCRKSAINAIP